MWTVSSGMGPHLIFISLRDNFSGKSLIVTPDIKCLIFANLPFINHHVYMAGMVIIRFYLPSNK